ncbi:MAG: esterase/lipase, partial [Arcobacteraceae bacterium]
FKEELEIESNIILNSTITINILKPISTNNLLRNKSYEEIEHSKIVDNYREKLTQNFMTKVYENLTISFDHIFILVLYLFPNNVIEKNHFKRLIYLIIKDILNSKLFFTKELNYSLLDLVSYEKHKAFDEIVEIAKKDNIVEEDEINYSINKENLMNSFTHDTIRLKNILRVLLSEILLIKDVKKMVKNYVNQDILQINETLYNLLKNEEQKEYENDYNKYWHYSGIKAKNIGTPYTLEANSDICVIALHGFSSAPKEVEKIALYLNAANFNVYAPRIKGHGTVPEDLKTTTWQDWYDSLSRAIAIATLKYKKIYLLGFSTGGLLALLSGKKEYKEFKGSICINAALNLNDIRVKTLIPAVTFWNDLVNAFDAKEYAKEYIDNIAQNPDINYDKHYIDSITQLSELMAKTKKNLKKAKIPIYIIQSSDDPVVNPSSAYEIYDAIESKNKKLEIIESSLHVIITQENEKLFKGIRDFIENHK